MARSSHSIGEPLFPYEPKPEQPEEAARREEYRRRLAEYLKDPEFRAIEGFPIGSDEDILALSDPPYYTACPNPFLPEILEQWQAERQETRRKLNLPLDDAYYRREPFAADVSEGKNDPIYNAHSYHTKVPHKAIMRYILHYTDPGDIVFDGFCGTGMTGVAAQLCGDKVAVESLGYTVKPDGRILDETSKPISRLGARKAVLNDLSPAATFITYNYNTPVDAHTFEKEAKRILKEVESEYGWMYETWHPHCDDPNKIRGKINFTIWSNVFVCPQCGKQSVFWDAVVDQSNSAISENWNCPGCKSILAKNPSRDSGVLKAELMMETSFDQDLGQAVQQAKQVPVLIYYSVNNKRYQKVPDKNDLKIIESIKSNSKVPFSPNNRMPEGDESRRNDDIGLTHAHHFYTRRNLLALASLWTKTDTKVFRFICSALLPRASVMHRVAGSRVGKKKKTSGGMTIGVISGTLYVPAISVEMNIFTQYEDRLEQVKKALSRNLLKDSGFVVQTQSSDKLFSLPNNSVEYLFVDPPFGSNLMYSDLNFLSEAWLRIFTNNRTEAIVSNFQRKGLDLYQKIMANCFSEYYRVLKPGHWITVEFHNSQNSVWNAIQESLQQAGFVLADIRTLDKQQGSFKQLTSSATVKQDLVISAYKPTTQFEEVFKISGGSEEGAWDFVRQHLGNLPLPKLEITSIEPQAERMPYLLFDRLVGFHLVRGLTIPLSAGEFYAGLGMRFLARDGMYFTPSQAADYDRLRLKAEKVEQLALFVTDEDSAIQWLRQALDPARGGKPQSYSDLQPEFLKQLHQEKHEKMPELMVMLEQNFLQDEAGRWFAPDPDKQADLDALRAKVLLHEFADYVKSKGKLKVFRSEAVRAGFSKAWKERDYETIVKVGERLPETALQEDAKLKMYFDNALSRYQRGPQQEALF